jgi:uncharacterized protein YqgC (DUF456 family)
MLDIELAQSVLVLLTIVVMGLSLLLIVLPPVPVGALEWAIAMIFGLLTGFERLTPPAAGVITVLMIAGVTSDIWLPALGFRTGEQVSCAGMVAFFIGMIVGSVLIPIPILGSFMGGVLGVVVVEYAQLQEMRQAVRKGGKALRLIIYSMIAEFIFAAAIFGVTLISILTTA